MKEVVSLGEQLRKYRDAAGLSQEALGDMLGTSHQQISKYEKGSDEISGETLQRIMEILNVSPNEFFDFNGMKSVTEIMRNGSVIENRLITRIANVIDEVFNK